MTPRVRRILSFVGYPLFYFACLMAFAYVSAPWDRLRTAVTSGFNTASPLRLEMDDLTWSWRFPGVAASGVRFVGEDPGPDAAGKPRPAPEYVVDDFYARVSVFPLLWGTSKLGFALDGFGGSIDGTVKTASDERVVDLELDQVDVAKVPYLEDLVGVPLSGTLEGQVDLTLPDQKLSKAEGAIELGILALVIGDGKKKIRDTIALPKIEAGQLTLKAEVTEGIVKLTELSTKGSDLELMAEGKIRLMDRLEASIVDVTLRYKFSDAYRNKDDTTRSLFGAPGSTTPGIFDLDPKMKRAKREDGFYAWHVTGPLGKPNFQPGTGGAAEPSASRKRTPLRPVKPRTAVSPPPAIPTPVAPVPPPMAAPPPMPMPMPEPPPPPAPTPEPEPPPPPPPAATPDPPPAPEAPAAEPAAEEGQPEAPGQAPAAGE